MATTKSKGDQGGNAEVNLRISAKDEASSPINAIGGSLSSLQQQVKNLSIDLLQLSKSVVEFSATATGRFAAVTAATAGTTIALGRQSGAFEAVKQAFTSLDKQIDSQRASLGDLASYATKGAKPLLEGIFFGPSETNTKWILQQKANKIAWDVVQAVDLPGMMGRQGGKFGQTGERLGKALGTGLEVALSRYAAGGVGRSLISGFQQLSTIVDSVYPKIKGLSEIGGNAIAYKGRVQQDLRFQREALQVRKAETEQGKRSDSIPDLQFEIEEIKKAEARFRGTSFEQATAIFRTPEFRRKVVGRLAESVATAVAGPAAGDLAEKEVALLGDRTKLTGRRAVAGLRKKDTSALDSQIEEIDKGIEGLRTQRRQNSELRTFIREFVTDSLEGLYEMAFESLGKALEKNPQIEAGIKSFRDRLGRALSDPGALMGSLGAKAKVLAMEVGDALGRIPSTVSQKVGEARTFLSDISQSVQIMAWEVQDAFSNAGIAVATKAAELKLGQAAQIMAWEIQDAFSNAGIVITSKISEVKRSFKDLGAYARVILWEIEDALNRTPLGSSLVGVAKKAVEAARQAGSALSPVMSRAGELGGRVKAGGAEIIERASARFRESLPESARSFDGLVQSAKRAGQDLSKALGGPVKFLFRDLPGEFRKTFAGVPAEFGKIGSEISQRISEKLALEGTLAERLRKLAAMAGAKEVGTNIGLRLGTAIADGLTQASRTTIGRELSRIEAFINRTVQTIPKVMGNLTTGLDKIGSATGVVSGLREPVKLFGFLQDRVTKATEAISAAGQQVFFFTSAIDMLRSYVVGGPYEILIGQNVRLEEQLLATRATIVANNKVLEDGQKVADPKEAILALGPEIEGVISDIRKKSLELVGVTSNELIGVFDSVTQQLNNVNLELGEAGDLTIAFAAGLGTIGLPLSQANQEIQSLLSGQIDNNSVLARSLGLTNAQLKMWVAQDVVYERLTKRLESFVDGNALAAKTVNGITSNIREVGDEIGRIAGAQLMDPFVGQLQVVYDLLFENQEALGSLAKEGVGQLLSAFTRVGQSAAGLGKDFLPILKEGGRLLWETLVNTINAVAEGLEHLRAILAPFVPILQELSKLIRSAAGPLLQMTISFKLLAGGIGLVQGLIGSLMGAIPLLGEALFFLEVRNLQLVNTFAALANPQTGIGASAATLLLFGRNMNSIPGVAAIVGKRLEATFGPLAGLIAAAIPSVSTFTLRMLKLGQTFGPVGQALGGLSKAIPGTIAGFSGLIDKISIFGVNLSQFAGPLGAFKDEIQGIVNANGGLGDILDKKLTNFLQEQGRLARNAAVTYGIWGLAIVGLAGSISLLVVKNTALRVILEGIYHWIKKLAGAIVNLLMEPLTQTIILVGALTTLIATGAATQMLKLAASFTAFAATQAPVTIKLTVEWLQKLSMALRSIQAGDALGSIGNAFKAFGTQVSEGIEKTKADQEAARQKQADSAALAEEIAAGEIKDEEGDVSAKEKRKEGQGPQTFGDLELDSDKDKADRKEKRRKKVGGGKRTGAAADRLDEILDLSEAQAEAANKAGLYEQGMIGSHKSTTQVSKSAKGASVQVTALGQAQQFATATAATLSATFKALFVTLGPIVAIIALFSAWGYAIEEVTKASRMQKEMQEELLAVLKEQEETIEKIKNLQDKPVVNALADQITEADLKTNEERIAFREGGGEAVLAVREARNLNEEGKEKGNLRKSAERTMDAVSKVGAVVPFFRRAFATAIGDEQGVAQAQQRIEDVAGSTTALRTVQANQIAGTETLVGAGEFLASTKSETAPVIKDLGVQVRETEKLLKEAQEKGSEARARELEGKLEQEKAAYEEAQDQILAYAGALEKIDFATAAQKETALAYADDLRGIVQDIEAEIEVAGIDFARLGTSFEQLEVESSNALAFFERGEGNPEQVKQRAGQLLSATQQQLDQGYISAEQALANYSVLFQRANSLELDDQQKLQEAILAARKRQTESSIKLEEAKVAKLKQLAAEGEVGQFESELGNVGLEREKAKVELEGLRSSYEEQNRLRVANFEDTRQGISREIARSKKELSEMSLGPGFQDQREALQTEIREYYKKLEISSESFRNQQERANRDFATEEANLLAQIAEGTNKEIEIRLKELQDQATAALNRSMALRKAQLQELRKEGIIFEQQQGLAVAKLQEQRVNQEFALERKRMQELLKNPKRFEREIRESNSRLAQLTLERFESERSAWEAQLALYKRYVDDQAEAARNAIEVENQELIKQAKLYEAIAQGIDQRNALLQKAQGFIESTGGSVADSLERIAKLTGNEVLQADIATNAAIIRRETLAKQLEIQTKIFEIEQKQAEIALIRREAENQIAIAKAKQQIISAQGELVVAQQQFERGDITEAELTSKKISLLTATTELQGLKLEEGLIQQEKELQPVLQGLLKAQQEQQMQSQLDQADIAVLETMPQALAMDAMTELGTRLGGRLGFTAKDLGELATQMREARGQLQGGYAQEVYGDANIFDDDISFREAQLSVGPGARNIERLKEQGIDLGFYTELGDITASPVANVNAQADGEGFFVEGDTGEAGSGLFDEQTGPLGEILAGVETATTNMDESIAQLEESLGKINLDNLQEALPELVGRDAIVETTFEAAGNVEQAIEQAIQESNAQLETITTGLEPLAEVRDFLGADGPLNKSLENLDLSPYLGENMDLLKDTGAIAQGVEQIVAQMPKAGEEAPAPAEGEGVYGPPLPGEADRPGRGKREIDNLSTRDVNTFLRQFEELISPEALEKARARGSEDGRRVTEGELRTVLVDTLRPMFLSAGSQSRLEQSSTSNILAAFRSAFGVQEQNESRGGRGGRSRTQYEIKPNLTFNINGNADENKIARTAMREFETILDRTLASAN